MKNHYHLLVTPQHESAIPDAMKELGGLYCRYYNHKHESIGSIWSGRYKPVLIESDIQWLRCLRYIEMNPVRAKVVERPEAYRWTSYRVHAMGGYTGWLADHAVFQALAPTAQERQSIYRKICAEPLSVAELTLQRFPLRFEAAAGS